jgi:putative transposase
MVADPGDYPWSSDPAHGENRPNPLLAPLPEGPSLGRTEPERARVWREKVRAPQVESEVLAIRRSVLTGQPFGTPAWAESRPGLAPLTPARRRGRPRKDIAMVSSNSTSITG